MTGAFELSACIEWLFAEAGPDLPARVRAAGAAGIPAVEFWGWQEHDLDALAGALAESGVALTSFVGCFDLMAAGAVEEVAAASGVARRLGCRTLIVAAGDVRAGLDARTQRATLVAALRRGAAVAAAHDVVLALEPLNSRVDHVGTFLDSSQLAFDVLEAVGSEHVRLLFDLYHATVMGEGWPALVHDRMDLVAHVHVADAPGRHEPGTGTIDWPEAIATIADEGYRGRIGLEYQPTTATPATFEVIRAAIDRR